jgi:hypothetical protein
MCWKDGDGRQAAVMVRCLNNTPSWVSPRAALRIRMPAFRYRAGEGVDHMEKHQQASGRAARTAQADALEARGKERRQSDSAVVLGIVRAAHAAGFPDMTRCEIQEEWERLDRAAGLPGRRDANIVSGRVRELVKRQALQALGEDKNRASRASRADGRVVSVVALISA